MQITLNQSEVEQAVAAYVDSLINLDGDVTVHINEDGTATVLIGDEVEGDTPPVVDKPKRTRGPNKKNAAEAKHVPVEAKKELQTSDGGQNESSTQEGEPTEEMKEEATAEAEEAASQEVTEEAAVQEKVQEEVVEEATPAAKPSLFANLRR